ncbi:MAG: alpha-L-arabinofuranosidase C-terminal domain-containing protein [Candidatus Bathyarchaeia archaeon]
MSKTSSLIVRLYDQVSVINPHIFGHFIEHLGRCIYPGIWVGEDSRIPNYEGLRRDAVHAFKSISAPIIRWPGGCFADVYHWEDGIGPREQRPRRVNIWWGGEESNEFGTDEFIKLCKLAGAEPYICANVGSGSPSEALAWLEYCNYSGNTKYASLRSKNGHPEPYRVKYWGVGNENWGCGGSFDPVYYAWEYRRFATFLKQADPSVKLIACGHTSRDWNYRFMEALRDFIHLVDYLSIHYYFGNPQRYGGDISFSDEQYLNLLFDIQHLEYQIQQAISVVDFFSEGRKNIGIAVDEWGVWHPQATVESGLYQQNTLRDAILAASVLNLFIGYSGKVWMANIAQAVNVLQSICLTRGEKAVFTPTYHVFNIYQPHMGNIALKTDVDSPVIREPAEKDYVGQQRSQRRPLKPLKALDAAASVSQDRKSLVITLVNRSLDEDFDVKISLLGEGEFNGGSLAVLNARDVRAYNDFDFPENVWVREEDLPTAEGREFEFRAERHSVSRLNLRLRR